jgi:glycosyltransferase involved in cell wall biosynthesis
MGEWDVQLFAPSEVLDAIFGPERASWMRPRRSTGLLSRLAWEANALPHVLNEEPGSLLFAPMGPVLYAPLATRAVVRVENLLPLLHEDELEVSPLDRGRLAALKLLYRASARSALALICASRHLRDRLADVARLSATDMHVIPHGIDLVDRTNATWSGPPLPPRFVLNVGQPIPYRRTLDLIEAQARLQVRAGVPPLLVAGGARWQDEGYERKCHELARTRRANVTFLGQLSHANVLAAIARAEVVVFPSVHEACPVGLLEALAARSAVVCSDIPPHRELAEDAAIFVEPSPDAIADGLERALVDSELAEGLRTRARHRAQALDWNRAASATAETIEQGFRQLGSRSC